MLYRIELAYTLNDGTVGVAHEMQVKGSDVEAMAAVVEHCNGKFRNFKMQAFADMMLSINSCGVNWTYYIRKGE